MAFVEKIRVSRDYGFCRKDQGFKRLWLPQGNQGLERLWKSREKKFNQAKKLYLYMRGNQLRSKNLHDKTRVLVHAFTWPLLQFHNFSCMDFTHKVYFSCMDFMHKVYFGYKPATDRPNRLIRNLKFARKSENPKIPKMFRIRKRPKTENVRKHPKSCAPVYVQNVHTRNLTQVTLNILCSTHSSMKV